jgi:hypothetical protein
VGDNLQYLLAEIQEIRAKQGEIMAGQASLIAGMGSESVQYQHKECGNETRGTRQQFKMQLAENEARARRLGCEKILHEAFS